MRKLNMGSCTQEPRWRGVPEIPSLAQRIQAGARARAIYATSRHQRGVTIGRGARRGEMAGGCGRGWAPCPEPEHPHRAVPTSGPPTTCRSGVLSSRTAWGTAAVVCAPSQDCPRGTFSGRTPAPMAPGRRHCGGRWPTGFHAAAWMLAAMLLAGGGAARVEGRRTTRWPRMGPSTTRRWTCRQPPETRRARNPWRASCTGRSVRRGGARAGCPAAMGGTPRTTASMRPNPTPPLPPADARVVAANSDPEELKQRAEQAVEGRLCSA